MKARLLRITGAILAVGLLAVAAGVHLSGCADALTDEDFYIHYDLVAPESADQPPPRDELIADIDGARDTIHAALFTLEDEGVADAIIRARDRGVDVRIVADADNETASGFQQLAEAQVLPQFGDGELDYLPDFFLASVLGVCEERAAEKKIVCTRGQGGEQGTMVRPGDFNEMSNNYVVIDQRITWNFALPLDGRQEHPIAWRATGSKFSRDFAREAQQLYGGTFAITLDTFSGMLKSRQDFNIVYNTSDGPIEVRFNPQERLLKELIDDVYAARASVYIMTDNLMNPFLLDALEYKAQAGFDVQILINDSAQASGSSRQRLEALGAEFVNEELPTLLIFDSASDRNGEEWPRKTAVLSHELVRGAPFDVERREPNDFVNLYPADLFYDGNMWVMTEHGSQVHERENIDRLIAFWRTKIGG